MGKKWNRSLFLNTNKYQKKIIVPILISCLLACAVNLFCLSYYYLGGTLHQEAPFGISLLTLNVLAPWLYVFFTLTIAFILLWTYYISNRMVGPFDRIIRELDDVIAGKKTTKIGTRKGDEMFEQLLKRVNTLIEQAK